MAGEAEESNVNNIDVNAVLKALTERRRINSIPLEDAVFIYDGDVVEVSLEARRSFRFTGLNNIDFIENEWPVKRRNE